MTATTVQLDRELNNVETAIHQVEQKLQRLANLEPQQRVLEDAEIEREINDISQKITKMRSSLRALPQQSRRVYEEEINNLESQRSDLITELRRIRDANHNDPAMRAYDQTQQNQQKADTVTAMLEEGLKITTDTNTTGQATMAMLKEDRQRLENINSNLNEIDTHAETAVAKARRMFIRAVCNKILAWIIVIIMAGLLALQFGLKYGLKKSDPSPSPSPSPTVSPDANVAEVFDKFFI